MGELETNCYLLWEEKSKETAIIDAADEGVAISEEIQSLGLMPKYILATHGHFDHNLGVVDLKLIYQIPYAASSRDMFLLERQEETAGYFLRRKIKIPNIKKIDIDLERKEFLELGGEKIKILKTSGHTPGGVTFLAGKLAFVGDLIFKKGGRGRTDFDYGDEKEINKSIQKILSLPERTMILSGHGEESQVGKEREFFIFDGERR